MMRPHRSTQAHDRPGFTIIELLVALVISLILISGATSLFMILQRSTAQQRVIGETRGQLHRSMEHLVRLVRNAHDIEASSTAQSLRITGGFTESLCGNDTCWIELNPETRRLEAKPPNHGSGHISELARGLDGIEFTYGFYDEGTQSVQLPFAQSVSSSNSSHVVAVQMNLSFDATEARAHFSGELSLHAVLRTKLFNLFST